MKSAILITAALFLMALNGVSLAQEDPLAPARQGLLECNGFDKEKKTCQEIASYDSKPDGTFKLISRQVLQQSPQLIQILETTAFVKDGRICAKIDERDFDMARYTLDGVFMNAEQAMNVRKNMRDSLTPMFNKTSCMQMFVRDGIHYAEYYLDDVLQTAFGITTVLWVHPNEAYVLSGEAQP